MRFVVKAVVYAKEDPCPITKPISKSQIILKEVLEERNIMSNIEYEPGRSIKETIHDILGPNLSYIIPTENASHKPILIKEPYQFKFVRL